MKPTVVSANVLFGEFTDLLKWQWIAGRAACERRFAEVAVRAARSSADLVGYLNSSAKSPTSPTLHRKIASGASPAL